MSIRRLIQKELPVAGAALLITAACAVLVVLGMHQHAQSIYTGKAVVPITKQLSPKQPAKPAPPVLYAFPDGGRELVPNYRFVALYGTPNTPALGVLGRQGAAASITRVKKLAAVYQPLSKAPIYPTFEIITTVASDTPTDNGDYSNELDAKTLLPWVETARKNGVYVVLDLQPGRTDFLAQAKQYESLLLQPNVGLALDPEWRLGPSELPIQDIGEVSIAEVNATAAWLSNLTKRHNLPQKLFVLHQFRMDMLPDRDKLDMSHANLAYIVQMDGQGTQQVKLDTWHVLIAHLQPKLLPGWKNFYEKDEPIRSPKATMELTPTPRYISYQ